MPSGEMDPVYSIGVKNRFLGIDSDMEQDPLELIRAAQEKPKKEKEIKPTKGKKELAKSAKVFKNKTVKIESPVEVESNENKKQHDRPRSDRGGRGRGRGNRGGRGGNRGRGRGGSGGGFGNDSGFDNNNQNGFHDNNNQTGYRGGFGKKESPIIENQTETGFGGGFGNENNEERRGGRSGFRGGRGGRGGRGRGRGGNREFDRRSGSDKSSVKAFEKRDGSGSYNWGTPQDQLPESEEQQNTGFGSPKEEDVPTETTEQTPETEETPVEEKQNEEPQQMTFDEWKKTQEENRSKPQFNIRRVETEKKGLKQLKKPTEEENEADGSLFFPKKYYEEKLKTTGRVKEHMSLDFQFAAGDNRHLDTSRRGGRARGGGSGRQRKREDPNKKDVEIALENTEEFPSLG